MIDTSPLYKYVVSRHRRGPAARPGHDARHLEAAGRPGLLHALVRRGRARCSTTAPSRGSRTTEYRVTAADPCYRWFLLNATGLDVEVEDVIGVDSRASPCRGSSAARSSRPRPARTGPTSATSATAAPRSAASTSSVTRTGYTGDRGYELWIPTDGALEVWDAIFEAGAAVRDLPRRASGRWMWRRVEAGPDPDRGRVHERAPRDQRPSSPIRRSRSASAGWSTSARPPTSTGAARCSHEQHGGRSGAAARRPGARLGGRRGDVREARPRADDLAVRRPVAGSGLQGQRAGRPRDLDHLGNDDQEDGRLRVGGQGASRSPAPGSRSSTASRESGARWPPPWFRCRSWTCRASGPSRGVIARTQPP